MQRFIRRDMQRWGRVMGARARDIGSSVRQSFGGELEQLMLRAEVWDTALARRLEVSRSEVFRWRTGRSLPSRHNLARLQAALHWFDNGTRTPLEPAEWDRLLVLAGHGQQRPANGP